MEKTRRIRKYFGLLFFFGALSFSLTGCFSNLQEIFGTPTPSPTPNPDVLIDPNIALSPDGGYAGTFVRVSGEGWMPGKAVILMLEDEEGRSGILAANIPDSQGSFEASFNYPSRSRWLRPGLNTVVAYTVNEELETKTEFVVIEPTQDPAQEPTATPVATQTETATATPTAIPTGTPTFAPTNTPLVEPTATATASGIPAATAANEASPTATATSFTFLLLPTSTVTQTSVPSTATATGTSTSTSTEAAPATATVTAEATARPDPSDSDISDSDPQDESDERPIIVSPDQIATPTVGPESVDPAQQESDTVGDGLGDGDLSTTDLATTPTVIVVSIAPTGTAQLTVLGSPTAVLGPFPDPAEPTATPSEPTFTPTWTPEPEVVVIQEWRGDYWDNPDLAGAPLLIRNDESIQFEWGSVSPSETLPNNNFSARWSRTVSFQEGIYTFGLEIDDGGRLYVDGQLLIDSWEDGGRRLLTAQKILSSGQHQIIVEYYERTGNAVARLGWERRATFQGWKGEYFANRNLNGRPIVVRDDAAIDFEWGVDSPAPALPEDEFSVRWQRTIALESATYRFTASSDDGMRVWLDDQLIIDEWRDQAAEEFTTELSVAKGQYTIRVEYYENTLGAVAKFNWESIAVPTLVPTPTWTPASAEELNPTPTWTPQVPQPTPTWTPQGG